MNRTTAQTPDRAATKRAVMLVAALVCWSIAHDDTHADTTDAHEIRIVDQETKRGVPLVELRTTANELFISDSGGRIAIDDPTLLNQRVFFHVSSHGYEHAADRFGFRGRALLLAPGKSSTIEVQRLNIAERLYRITGAGIYRDTIKLGKTAPLKQPLLNAKVTGQDSVQAVVMKGRIHWFWGDTNRIGFPLGQFNTSGATSLLPSEGGLEANIGIDLDYFQGMKTGFSRPMFQRENGILIWVHGAFVGPTADGSPGIYAHWSRYKSLAKRLSHGLALYDETKNQFEMIQQYDDEAPAHPRGHSFRVTQNGKPYIYFADPYPVVRVRANKDAILDVTQYESLTPLQPGTHKVDVDKIERADKGDVVFAWKQDTAAVPLRTLRQWTRSGKLDAKENRFHTVDAASGKAIVLHRGSVHWNAFRKRYVMIATQSGGEHSFLGDVWYAESKSAEGPFPIAVLIARHNKYSFYNPTQHPFFDQDNGRTIYFEGTYTSLFSAAKVKTPLYDYNQIMYKLDLSDRRLAPAQH